MEWILILYLWGGETITPQAQYNYESQCETALEVALEADSRVRGFCIPGWDL